MKMIRSMDYRVTCVIRTRNTSALLFGMKIVIAGLCITCTSTIPLIISLRAQSTKSTSSACILASSVVDIILIIDETSRSQNFSTQTARLSIWNVLMIELPKHNIFVIRVRTIDLLLLLLNCRLKLLIRCRTQTSVAQWHENIMLLSSRPTSVLIVYQVTICTLVSILHAH